MGVFVFFSNESFPLFRQIILDLLLSYTSTLDPHRDRQSEGNNACSGSQKGIYWSWIPVQRPKCEGIQGILGQVDQSRNADDRSVDPAKGGESENFCCIVPVRVYVSYYAKQVSRR
jgi:hypothetical protein